MIRQFLLWRFTLFLNCTVLGKKITGWTLPQQTLQVWDVKLKPDSGLVASHSWLRWGWLYFGPLQWKFLSFVSKKKKKKSLNRNCQYKGLKP
jgi:hypothetical protein